MNNIRQYRILLTVVVCVFVFNERAYSGTALEQQKPELVITVLGSGTPVPSASQFGPAILVQAEGRNYIFDCGRACTSRLAQVDVGLLKSVDRLFITHLHSDHVIGIPDLWLNGWLQERASPLKIWGPVGTKSMMTNLREAYDFDIKLRQADNVPASGDGLDDDIVELSDKGGVILKEGGVVVTAFAVDHGKVEPAYGYKVEYQGRSVLISGDTSDTPNLYKYGKGVDVLLLEVMSPDLLDMLGKKFTKEQVDRIKSYHLTASQAANVFALSAPGIGVYYHTPNNGAFVESLIDGTRKNYKGPLAVSHDLLQIRVSDTIELVDLRVNLLVN